MQTNLLPLDRAIRLGGGLFLLASPILELQTYPYNLLGILPIATAIAGYCPLYALARMILPSRRSSGPQPLASSRHEAIL